MLVIQHSKMSKCRFFHGAKNCLFGAEARSCCCTSAFVCCLEEWRQNAAANFRAAAANTCDLLVAPAAREATQFEFFSVQQVYRLTKAVSRPYAASARMAESSL